MPTSGIIYLVEGLLTFQASRPLAAFGLPEVARSFRERLVAYQKLWPMPDPRSIRWTPQQREEYRMELADWKRNYPAGEIHAERYESIVVLPVPYSIAPLEAP